MNNVPQGRPVIFMSAAEASGDLHAANLIDAIRSKVPDARFIGAAGPRMQSAGCECLIDLTANATMLAGPALRPVYYIRAVRMLQRAIREIRPDVLVPVDSPALNWHLAKAAKQAGIKVMYYIAPQVWGWAAWRVRKLASLTDRVACILPFEQRYLSDRGVEAEFVGHPLFDHIPPRPDPPADLPQAWAEGRWKVALLPGSRGGEIRRHVDDMLQIAKAIRRRWPKAEFRFPMARAQDVDILTKYARGQNLHIEVARTPEVLAESHFALVKSGTITLEAAYYGVPMVILYRTSAMMWALHKLLGRWLLNTPHLSLVNILAGRRLVPEFMPWQGSAGPLVRMTLEVMDDLGWLFETRQALMDLTDSLCAPNGALACDNAARLVIELLK